MVLSPRLGSAENLPFNSHILDKALAVKSMQLGRILLLD